MQRRSNKARVEVNTSERLLAVLVALAVAHEPARTRTLSDQVSALRNLGLETADIARILGKPSNYVAALGISKKTKKLAKARKPVKARARRGEGTGRH